ncbi:UDP-N-acetylglucosamine transferase subunit alg13 [Penicillium subrubescens]|uniref:UDP-N-acetylglucosamine transferase subunit ALG13 n=1 Tax=Penicillium subrubescens TaxID=1316194 RepID=A0A1Q5SXK3_9EURO|nr:UDP-N-acetylglucosamine transferase subunit alg13 [Penicillium subrubescens]KAJ5905302.1 UDP-N-acetylglucosamine transferase subunit alg13 [Penicillium subrubescens]OKO92672.1 UDP-N-acetylglucosamine transferase subunit alg13 [Penicillium subrubescens]
MVVKLCLVTVGATAPFEKLVQAVLHESFLAELEKHKFTRLLIQHGKGGQQVFDAYRAEYESGNIDHGIEIGGFDLRPNMIPYLRMVRDDPGDFQELGMVISHAGTGSILDALRAGVPLVVVPNPDLADNHQQELADQLAGLGYAIIGKLDDIPSTVGQAVKQGERAPFFRHGQKGREIPMGDELSWVD